MKIISLEKGDKQAIVIELENYFEFNQIFVPLVYFQVQGHTLRYVAAMSVLDDGTEKDIEDCLDNIKCQDKPCKTCNIAAEMIKHLNVLGKEMRKDESK